MTERNNYLDIESVDRIVEAYLNDKSVCRRLGVNYENPKDQDVYRVREFVMREVVIPSLKRRTWKNQLRL